VCVAAYFPGLFYFGAGLAPQKKQNRINSSAVQILTTANKVGRDAQQAQMTHDFLSSIAATGQWPGLNFDSIGPYGFLATPNINRLWAGPDANASILSESGRL